VRGGSPVFGPRSRGRGPFRASRGAVERCLLPERRVVHPVHSEGRSSEACDRHNWWTAGVSPARSGPRLRRDAIDLNRSTWPRGADASTRSRAILLDLARRFTQPASGA
jgi:hypothetical protein